MADTTTPQPLESTRPRSLMEVDTVWFDVTTVLRMPPGHVTGITRTIYKLLAAWIANPPARTKFCAFVSDQGVGEVCPHHLHRHMYLYDRPASAAPSKPEEAEPATDREFREYSRYWYIPWTMRHKYRTVEYAVKTGVTKFWLDPNPPRSESVAERPYFPPYAQDSIVRLVDLGPRDLLLSLGGLWVIANFKNTITPARQRGRFQFVSLIYDLIPVLAPQFVPDDSGVEAFVPTTEAQLRESSVTLTISEFSKSELLRYSQERFIPVGPVEVFTLGSDITPIDATAVALTKTQHSRPFVLSVGTIESRKNHYGMYLAWRKLLRKLGPDRAPDLVFVGKPGWHSDNLLYMIRKDPLVKDKIIVKSGVADRELDWLYKNCLFTLYPSLYEGWGLPVEESFIYGKTCITTNVSSLPEVGGVFAEYVEPEDVDGIVQAVIKCLDPVYREGREKLIREEFRANTWQKAGGQLQTILQKYFSFPADRARRKESAKPASRSKLARAMSFFW